jgi:hypothetical protein
MNNYQLVDITKEETIFNCVDASEDESYFFPD